jgi:hypothetical protein
VNRSTLQETLAAVGKPSEIWESGDGSEALVLPYGGRILGLFAPDDESNLFWTHPCLGDAASAQYFYQSKDWHNSGGDRTWLAPEVDFFFPDFPDLKRYWQPRELESGSYNVSRANGALSLTIRATLLMFRAKRTVDVEITKSLLPALNPLRHELSEADAALKFAGYTLRTSLTVCSSGPPAQIALWQLAQMPHGGDMLIPTFFRSDPVVYFGTIAPTDLVAGDHLVRYKMRATGGSKIGLPAVATTGRAGYIYGDGDSTSLVIRTFTVNPSGEYVDVPTAAPELPACAFQACSIDNEMGRFSELEYHAPAVGTSRDGSKCEDESQLWAFRGSRTTIESVAQRLLTTDSAE